MACNKFSLYKEDILRLHSTTKMTCADIAKQLGCSSSTVGKYLKQAGLVPHGFGMQAPDESFDECIIELHRQGEGNSTIARTIGKSREFLRGRMKVLGLASNIAKKGRPKKTTFGQTTPLGAKAHKEPIYTYEENGVTVKRYAPGYAHGAVRWSWEREKWVD